MKAQGPDYEKMGQSGGTKAKSFSSNKKIIGAEFLIDGFYAGMREVFCSNRNNTDGETEI